MGGRRCQSLGLCSMLIATPASLSIWESRMAERIYTRDAQVVLGTAMRLPFGATAHTTGHAVVVVDVARSGHD